MFLVRSVEVWQRDGLDEILPWTVFLGKPNGVKNRDLLNKIEGVTAALTADLVGETIDFLSLFRGGASNIRVWPGVKHG